MSERRKLPSSMTAAQAHAMAKDAIDDLDELISELHAGPITRGSNERLQRRLDTHMVDQLKHVRDFLNELRESAEEAAKLIDQSQAHDIVWHDCQRCSKDDLDCDHPHWVALSTVTSWIRFLAGDRGEMAFRKFLANKRAEDALDGRKPIKPK